MIYKYIIHLNKSNIVRRLVNPKQGMMLSMRVNRSKDDQLIIFN